MSEILFLLIGLFAAFAFGICWLTVKLTKAAWNSWWFWTAALFATVALFPFTAGMSPAMLVALILVRVFIVGRVIENTTSR